MAITNGFSTETSIAVLSKRRWFLCKQRVERQLLLEGWRHMAKTSHLRSSNNVLLFKKMEPMWRRINGFKLKAKNGIISANTGEMDTSKWIGSYYVKSVTDVYKRSFMTTYNSSFYFDKDGNYLNETMERSRRWTVLLQDSGYMTKKWMDDRFLLLSREMDVAKG